MEFLSSSQPRYELKFIAKQSEYHRVLNWLRHHPECLKTEYPDRQINNIYFDSFNHNSYCQNIYGSSSKSKVRFRWYGSSVKPLNGSLEVKCKRNLLNWKLIYKISGGLNENGNGWRAISQKIRQQLPENAKKWMESNPLPILINRYKRKYFVLIDKKVRVTLDSNLEVFDQTRKPFLSYSFKANIPQTVIMELKFPRELRNHVSYMFSDIPLRGSRCSKYMIGFLAIKG